MGIANEEIPILGQPNADIVEESLIRCRFARRFVSGRSVLDVGCASGHGSLGRLGWIFEIGCC